MSSHSAFFYGTLMAPAVLHRVCHGSSSPEQWQSNLLTIRPAMLHQHQRHRVKDADYPAVIPCDEPNACVRGTHVSGLTDGDLWRLDIFEGSEYERRQVQVKILDDEGKEVESAQAETYIWIAGEDQLEKREWDFDEFRKEKMKRWVGSEGEPEYAEVDEAVKAQQTDPTRGRGLNGNITKTLEEHRTKSQEALQSAV